MKKSISIILSILIFALQYNYAFAEQSASRDTDVPFFSTLFYGIGTNTLHSFTYNYGLNYAIGIVGTYAFVESGADWEWNKMAYNNKAIAYCGIPFGVIGTFAPIAAPLWMYYYGRNHQDKKLQIAGLAVGQAAMLGVGISSLMKAFTGRHAPDILDRDSNRGDFSDDFAFGFLERGIINGWPSSHTAIAFAMATTLKELYPDNKNIQIYATAYEFSVGFAMSLFAHWASESFAGALVGYAIGKSVGSNFNKLLNNTTDESKYSFSIAPNGFVISANF